MPGTQDATSQTEERMRRSPTKRASSVASFNASPAIEKIQKQDTQLLAPIVQEMVESFETQSGDMKDIAIQCVLIDGNSRNRNNDLDISCLNIKESGPDPRQIAFLNKMRKYNALLMA